MSEPCLSWVDQRGDSDCWIACLSSLTGIDIALFPQPPALDRWKAEAVEYGNRVRRFVQQRGWLLMHVWRFVPTGYAIAGGPSPRGIEDGHAVVVRNGELVHDPHPSRSGLSGPIEDYEFLIRIHPKYEEEP